MRITYTRHKKAQFQTSASRLRQLLQDDPITYLKIAGVEVDEEIARSDGSGEWTVVEKLSIPLIPDTKFKTKFTRIEGGSRWQSWASLGVYVDNSFTIDGDHKDNEHATSQQDDDDDKINDDDQLQQGSMAERPIKQESDGGTCSATEVATLQCPFYLYPLVRWQFDKNHDANMIKLQEYVSSSS